VAALDGEAGFGEERLGGGAALELLLLDAVGGEEVAQPVVLADPRIARAAQVDVAVIQTPPRASSAPRTLPASRRFSSGSRYISRPLVDDRDVARGEQPDGGGERVGVEHVERLDAQLADQRSGVERG